MTRQLCDDCPSNLGLGPRGPCNGARLAFTALLEGYIIQEDVQKVKTIRGDKKQETAESTASRSVRSTERPAFIDRHKRRRLDVWPRCSDVIATNYRGAVLNFCTISTCVCSSQAFCLRTHAEDPEKTDGSIGSRDRPQCGMAAVCHHLDKNGERLSSEQW